jgi:hypothetical protein
LNPSTAVPTAPPSGARAGVSGAPIAAPGSEASSGGGAGGAGSGGTGAGGTGAGGAGVGQSAIASQAGPTTTANRSPTLEELDRKNERIKRDVMRSICNGC